jgi:ABC-type Fe3+/spermidine/putrescine transport system ATPase subunit
MVRPHRIDFSPDGGVRGPEWNVCRGRVRRVSFVGAVLTCEVEVGGAEIIVERHTLPGLPEPHAGDEVGLAWRVADTLAFPREAA